MFGPSDISVRWAWAPDRATRREVAWELLRSLVPNPAARITNTCERCGGPHGRVRVEYGGVHASVAYAGGWAFACVAPHGDAAAVGVDAESVSDAKRDAAGLTGIVRAGVITSIREWTRIEAVLKADGRGLRVDPAGVALIAHGPEWTATVAGSDREFVGADVIGPPGIFVSVAFAPVSGEEAQEAASGRATRSAAAHGSGR